MYRVLLLFNNNKKLISEFTRFVIVGIINTCCNYAVFLFFLLSLKIYYLIAGALGFLVGAVIGFTLNRIWTFKSDICYKKGISKYLAIQLFCLLIHSLTQFSVINFFHISEILSQLAGIAVTTFLNFFLSKNLVFK